jgi:hypothetical protein
MPLIEADLTYTRIRLIFFSESTGIAMEGVRVLIGSKVDEYCRLPVLL